MKLVSQLVMVQDLLRELTQRFHALEPNVDLFVFLGMIGFLIGVVPIMIGLLWYPFIKKLGKNIPLISFWHLLWGY